MKLTDESPEVIEFRRILAETRSVSSECHLVVDHAMNVVTSRVNRQQMENAQRFGELIDWLEDDPVVESDELDDDESEELEECYSQK